MANKTRKRQVPFLQPQQNKAVIGALRKPHQLSGDVYPDR